VRLTPAEITRLAQFKSLSEFEFIQQFTRLTSDRRGLALQEQSDGACIFLQGANCAVQPVKPQQCREFPNLWNFPGFEKVCHAKLRVVTLQEHGHLLCEIQLHGAAPRACSSVRHEEPA
jgi:Fe-S-cluster containining protein